MTKEREPADKSGMLANEADAVWRYLAHADGESVEPPAAAAQASDPDGAPDARTLAVFARCDAALALTPRLADSPALAWAFAEASQLARGEPPPRAASLPWHRRAAIAWSAAALSAAAAVAFAVLALAPAGEDAAAPSPAATGTQIRFTPIIVPVEMASRFAEIDPVALVAETVAVDSRSIAVLPFSAVASSPGDEVTAVQATTDAIYDRLVRQLAAIPGLYVIDPRTAAIYTNMDLQPEEIALYLGVRGVVQGRVDSDGDTISLDMRFTDAAGVGHSIDRDFERPVADVAMLQNDIALSVLDSLIAPQRTGPTLN